MTPFQFMTAALCLLVGVISIALAALVVYCVVVGVRYALKKGDENHERE